MTFVVAPLPNAIFAHCGSDDFSTDYEGSGPVDLGRFITAIIVVTGFALPLVLSHSEVIKPAACAMSIIGGAYVLEPYTSQRPLFINTFLTGSYMEQSRPIPQPSDKRTPTTTDAFLCIFTLDFCVISTCFPSHMNTTSIHHTGQSSSANPSTRP